MGTLVISGEGQLTLPEDALKHLGVRPGQQVSIQKLPDGRLEIMAFRPTGDISDFFGYLKGHTTTSLTIEEIGQIAASGWAGER